jgi:hypothetical protein
MKSLFVLIVWFFGCLIIGFILTFAYGQHGSIFYLVLGIESGVVGGLVHAALLRWMQFLHLKIIARSIASWAAVLIFWAIAGGTLEIFLDFFKTFAVAALLLSFLADILSTRKYASNSGHIK